MLSQVKKAILFGLGAVDYSREKLEKSVNQFLDKENIDRKEGRKMVDDIVKKAQKYKKGQDKYIKKVVKKTVDDLGLVTKKDLDAIKKHIYAKSTGKKTKSKR